MISIRFGIPGKYWLPWLCPATCGYYLCPIQYDNALCCTLQEIQKFEDTRCNSNSFLLTRNLRVAKYDSDCKIVNRHAHTCIMLVYDTEKRSRKDQWKLFHYNLKAIAFLYSRDDIPVDITKRIEKMVWRHCGDLKTKLTFCTEKMLSYMVPKCAEKMLAPDYVWRTGKSAGRTTISVLTDRWNQRLASMD